MTENVAGVKFIRTVNESGPHPVEVLTSRGPISELITVEVCSLLKCLIKPCCNSMACKHNS